ncbi:MAG: riboflavin kinase [Patescibacteria group bacterium]
MKLVGKVVKGQGFATLAFGLPTANLEVEEYIDLEPGAYVGIASVNKTKYDAVMYAGVVGSDKFEVHLFDFSGDLYGQQLEVEILELISAHVPWVSEQQMKAKVAADVALAKDYFATRSSSV